MGYEAYDPLKWKISTCSDPKDDLIQTKDGEIRFLKNEVEAWKMRAIESDRDYLRARKLKKPERYIINKNATILFWEDGDKTIVKRTKDDDFNARLGFLTAYFLKNSGLSRTQANKYLSNLKVEE